MGDFQHRHPFYGIQRGGFAGGGEWDEEVGSAFYLAFHQRGIGFVVNITVGREWGDKGCSAAFQFGYFHLIINSLKL